VLAGVAGRWAEAGPAAAAFGLLLVWIVLYVRVSAPINKQLTAAVDIHDAPANLRVLQHNWDRVIAARATLQGLAVAALCLTLMT
jgi:hypothetical protein